MDLSLPERIACYGRDLRAALAELRSSDMPLTVPAFAALERNLVERYAPRRLELRALAEGLARTGGSAASESRDELERLLRQRFFLDLQHACVAVVREGGLGRPLWEYRDRYEQLVQQRAAALPRPAESLSALREAISSSEREDCLPRGELETLFAVGLSSWYWLGAGPELAESAIPAALLGAEAAKLCEFRRRTDQAWEFPAMAADLRDYLEDEYSVDTWGDLALLRPDLIEPLTGKPPGQALTDLVAKDFARRQFPAVEQLVWSELEELRRRGPRSSGRTG